MKEKTTQTGPSIHSLLASYKQFIIPLIFLALLSNGLTLWLPRLTSHVIDSFITSGNPNKALLEFAIASSFVFLLTFGQTILQTLASEKVARDLRDQLSDKISNQSFATIQKITPAKILTNLTSDIDAIKNFVSQAVVNTVSSVFLIIGGSILLISIDWRLGLAVLAVLPVIAGAFIYIFSKVKTLFTETREVIDSLNKVINESIVGAALIRILNSRGLELKKFGKINTKAKHLGIKIVKLFASMIPIITFSSNLAVLIILILGGKFVINGSMTLGDFASFNSYMIILIFPILILGFVSNIVAQAQASYSRISEILDLPASEKQGTIIKELKGEIELKNISLIYGDKNVLKDVSLNIKPKSRVAIIGPTAAGKTQLLNLLIGLVPQNAGTITYDGTQLKDFDKENLYKQVGLVFQDSILFNLSLKENIAFNTAVLKEDLNKAIETAELGEFIHTLPDGLETIISERGTSLSGGQKQRIMLARALALNPKVLLLDDFTARVDAKTEAKILQNIKNNYPRITLVSVTQKIASVEHYDQIIVLMEGEVIASGLHEDLLNTSPEYNQIFNSQKSANIYELQSK